MDCIAQDTKCVNKMQVWITNLLFINNFLLQIQYLTHQLKVGRVNRISCHFKQFVQCHSNYYKFYFVSYIYLFTVQIKINTKDLKL